MTSHNVKLTRTSIEQLKAIASHSKNWCSTDSVMAASIDTENCLRITFGNENVIYTEKFEAWLYFADNNLISEYFKSIELKEKFMFAHEQVKKKEKELNETIEARNAVYKEFDDMNRKLEKSKILLREILKGYIRD